MLGLLRRNVLSLFLKGRGWLLDFPTDFHIEVSSACNLKCPYCARTYSDRPRLNMKETVFLKAIQEISYNRPDLKHLVFHWFGEALLNPQLFDFVEIARGYLPNTAFSVSSNANLLSSKKIDQLLRSSLDRFGVWTDTLSAEQYEVLRTNGNLKKVEESVFELLEKRKHCNREDIEIYIGMVLYKNNLPFVESFVKRWEAIISKYKNVHLYTSESHDWAGQVPYDNVLNSAKKTNFYIKTLCRMPFTSGVLSATGYVTPCCFDCNLTLSGGNIEDYSIKEIWNGAKFSSLREKLLTASISSSELCYHCYLYKRAIPNVLRISPIGRRIFHKNYDKYKFAGLD